ncbi:myosin-IIIb-like isoform X3 [Halichondria panicea]|uniref:myosin-IIIb-like isoform X3 n=1 Tax=Halichondria panicea TaxID=6063 RepID=UPI00312B978C
MDIKCNITVVLESACDFQCSISWKVRQDDTVKKVKEFIFSQVGFAEDQQELTHTGQLMKDDKKLSNYAVSDGSIIQLRLVSNKDDKDEAAVFRRNFFKLAQGITDPGVFGARLYAAFLVTAEVRDNAANEIHPPCKRVLQLLSVVEAQIKLYPAQNFPQFIKILCEEKCYYLLATSLCSKLDDNDEAAVFRRNFFNLAQGITYPTTFGERLHDVGLVTAEVRDNAANDFHPSCKRALQLLSAVEAQIKLFPAQNFPQFIKILCKEKYYLLAKSLCPKLAGKYIQELEAEIPTSDASIDPRPQGEGNYGEVFKARNVQTGGVAAIKVMEAILDKEDDIRAELNVFENHSHHPNIINFYGAFVKKDSIADDQLWIVMEHCSAGSVTDLVKEMKEKGERLSEDTISYILREVLAGLSYMHSACILHRDVKGQNVLLTSDARVKLIDFGISAVIDSPTGKRRTTVGTPYWMAPEVIACESQMDCDYDSRADVWSLGITAIEIADSTPPLFGENPMRALLKIPKNKSPTVQKPSEWSNDLNDFITQCVHKDYEQRPTTVKLLSHNFVRYVPREPRIIRRKLMGVIDTLRHKTESVLNESTTSISTVDTTKRSLATVSTLNTVDDLATLEFIDENVIVSQLWKRYKRKLIYTNVGDILVSINPFQQLDIYNEKFSYLYCHAHQSHLPPHIFAMAGSAYRAMGRDSVNQCCVVSGESGAGKTEASNLLVQQFMKLGRSKTRSLEEKILKVNPLIESFGNAKTIINENSSRFGKYLELRFTSDGQVVGAHLSQYLLEKSRVVSQARREKNFHIFYYLLAGLSARKQLKEFRLSSIHHHHKYLEHRGGTHKVNMKKDALFKKKFDLVDSAFKLFGFNKSEFECVCRILAAVLNIGDIRIEGHTHSYLGEVSSINQMDKIEDVAYLLDISSDKLHQSLISSQVVTHGEIIVKPTTIEQSMDTRDAIAKALYGRLFSWIVNKINPVLDAPKDSSAKIVNIGILDIFGFENIRTNSFEQLCINVANEQLQFYFNQQVFAWEQEEYEREGVGLSLVSYMDNRPLLELLLTRPIGLLALLDEESKFPRATDLSLAEKFHSNFKSSSYYKKPKDGGPTFTILHYAGPVTYETVGFLEKNRDTIKSDVAKLLRESTNEIVHSMFYTPLSRTGSLSAATKRGGPSSATPLFSRRAPFGNSGYKLRLRRPTSPRDRTPLSSSETLTTNRAQTVSTYFINSLRELMSKMLIGKAHFVRCIRPNEMKSPGQFQADKVMVQLRYTGVLETTRIRREGFSHRIPFDDFLERYKVISYPLSGRVSPSPTNCVQLLMQAGLEKWVIGKTKVFLKYYHVDRLSQLLASYHRSATNIQRVVRGWRGRKVAAVLREERRVRAVVRMQTVVRGYLARRHARRMVEHRNHCAIKIQAVVRGWIARSRYLHALHRRLLASLKIQAVVRGWLAKQLVKRLRKELKKKQEAEARRKSSIRWKLHQRAIASIEIKKAEEQSSKPAAPKLRGNSCKESTGDLSQVGTPTRANSRLTAPVPNNHHEDTQHRVTLVPPKQLLQSSSISTTRMLFEDLITQQREAATSPQRPRARVRVTQAKPKDGHHRVKEKKLRSQKNSDSIFQQLLVRFDPSSFVSANQQVQS